MAAKAGESHEITGFSQPINNKSGQWQPPPRKHCIAQVTGGLSEIYTKIQSGWQNAEEDYSKFINEDNFFQPNSKGGLMAGRYQVIRVLGRGNSSTILQAQDTFRPGLYEVAIKVLKPEYYRLGYQESHLIAELNEADSHNFCGIVKLLNTFTLGPFFCMTYELLRPRPLHQVFKKIHDKTEKLMMIRKVALRMLQILGFLGQQNVIHADLKPENILCKSENISDGIKVIDFGNAIHGVYEELSLYYDEFELQTLLYRAPEVLLGLPFGQEIDMWSLGCILAELYLGKPLFWAKQREDLLTQMTSLFGPLPTKIYQRAKFFTRYKDSVGQPLSFMDNFSNFGTKLGCIDFKFVSFLQGMLTFDPGERISVSEAIQHPFLAPEMAIKYVLPFKTKGSEAYSPVDLTSSMYTHTPAGTLDPRNKHLTSLDLLHHGTRDTSSTTKQKVVHVVAPFEPRQSSKGTEPVDVKVEPKSEPDNEIEIVGAQLPDAPHKAIKKPLVRSAPVVMKQDVPKVTKRSSSSKDQLKVTKSSSSSEELPPEPVLKEDMSKRPRKSEDKPLIGHHVGQNKSDANQHLEQMTDKPQSENKVLMRLEEDGQFDPHWTLEEVPAAKSKLRLSEEMTYVPEKEPKSSSESLDESSQPFRYLKQQKMKAVAQRNKSLGVNMQKLSKSQAKGSDSSAKSKLDRPNVKSKLTKDIKKSKSFDGTKGMLICNAQKSVHQKKDVTLLVAKDQMKKVPKATAKRKSVNVLKGPHQRQSSSSGMEHKHLKHSADSTACPSSSKDTTKYDERTSVYDLIDTPEKTEQKARSRKRSLQMTGDSTVKRSKTKLVPLETKVMKGQVKDAVLSTTDKCLIEALDSNSPCSDRRKSAARLSPSSEPSSELTSWKSKMSILSRLQAAGDKKTMKHSISSPPKTSSTSSQPVSVKSPSQTSKRCSLESSALVDQPTKTMVAKKRCRTKSHVFTPKKGNVKRKAKPLPLPASSSSSSPLVAPPLQLQPSPLRSYLSSKSDSKPSVHPIKQSSPALQIKRLFSSSSHSSSSPRQQGKASPCGQSKRIDTRESEFDSQISDEEDEILLL